VALPAKLLLGFETQQYYPISVDLSAYGGQVIYLAFRFETLDPVLNNYPGARIDDIHIFNGPASVPGGAEGMDRVEKTILRERKLREMITATRKMNRPPAARISSPGRPFSSQNTGQVR
jgi:hypothetical protein